MNEKEIKVELNEKAIIELKSKIEKIVMECTNKIMKEINIKKKIKVDEAEIVVRGTVENPYFEIKYRQTGNTYYNIGFGSYNIKNVFQWLEEEFEFSEEYRDE